MNLFIDLIKVITKLLFSIIHLIYDLLSLGLSLFKCSKIIISEVNNELGKNNELYSLLNNDVKLPIKDELAHTKNEIATIHKNKEYKTPEITIIPDGNLSRDVMLKWLKLNKFIAFTPKSKNWKYGGMVRHIHGDSLYLFIGKKSFDFVYLQYGEVLPKDDNDKISVNGYKVYRNYYNADIMLHRHVSMLVEDFIQSKCLDKYKISIGSSEYVKDKPHYL